MGLRIICNENHWGIGAMISAAATQMVGRDDVVDVQLINMHGSWFDRFFEPLSGTVTETVFNRRREVKRANGRHKGQLLEDLRNYASLYLRTLGVWHHHVMISRDCLGVHYRGTDKYLEVKPVPYDVVIDRAERLRAHLGLSSVFFCTDDDRFPVPKHWFHFRYHLKASRSLHHDPSSPYRHIDEAFIQLINLAYCRHLFIGRSCYSEAAAILSKAVLHYYN